MLLLLHAYRGYIKALLKIFRAIRIYCKGKHLYAFIVCNILVIFVGTNIFLNAAWEKFVHKLRGLFCCEHTYYRSHGNSADKRKLCPQRYRIDHKKRKSKRNGRNYLNNTANKSAHTTGKIEKVISRLSFALNSFTKKSYVSVLNGWICKFHGFFCVHPFTWVINFFKANVIKSCQPSVYKT